MLCPCAFVCLVQVGVSWGICVQDTKASLSLGQPLFADQT